MAAEGQGFSPVRKISEIFLNHLQLDAERNSDFYAIDSTVWFVGAIQALAGVGSDPNGDKVFLDWGPNLRNIGLAGAKLSVIK